MGNDMSCMGDRRDPLGTNALLSHRSKDSAVFKLHEDGSTFRRGAPGGHSAFSAENDPTCAIGLQAPLTARSFASKTSTSSTREHGSRGEKWNDMAVGTALVEATNVIVAPSKSDLWNTKLQNSIFSHNLPHNIPRDGRHGLKARPELNRGHVAPADYQVMRQDLDDYWQELERVTENVPSNLRQERSVNNLADGIVQIKEFAADSARKTTHVVDAVATKVSAVGSSEPTCSASGTSNHLSLTSSIDREAGLECLQCHRSSQSRRGVCGACGSRTNSEAVFPLFSHAHVKDGHVAYVFPGLRR